MMMLFVALLAIAAMAVAPSMAFRGRRDREEELIHRGVQYSRAIRRYVKKFGRYPTRLEELENTNNMRFLRKRYKDPITGEDFKVLHVGDVQRGAVGLAGSAALGAAAAGGGLNSSAILGGAAAQGGQAAMAAAATVMAAGAGGGGSHPLADNTDTSSDNPDQAKKEKSDSGTTPLGGRTFGGGPIVGVASASKEVSIREFNHKNHYNLWQFIYDPAMDRGGLITTPAQPPLQVSQPLNQPQSESGSGNAPQSAGTPASGQSPPPAQPEPQQ